MNAAINSKFAKIQGVTIHYLESGGISDKSVLFLHGASFCAETWKEIGTLNLLAENG